MPTLRVERRAVTALFAVLGATFGTFAARIPDLQQGFELSNARLGVALAGLMVGALGGMALGGMLVAHTGSRRLLAAGLAGFLPALATLPFMPGIVGITAMLVLFGLANSLVDVGVNTQAAHIERRHSHSILSSFHAAFSAAALAAAGVAALVAAAGVGLEPHFAAVALIGLATAAAALPRTTSEPANEAGSQASALALPGRALAVPAAIAFCMVLAEDIANTWSAVFLRSVADASAGLAAAGFGLYAGGTLLGRLVADRLIDAQGHRATLLISGAVATAGATLPVALPSPAPVAIGLFLLGAGLAPVLPVLVTVAAGVDPHRAGTAIAAVTLVGYAGSAIGPPLTGALADKIGLQAAFALVPAAVLAMTLLALGLRHDGTGPS